MTIELDRNETQPAVAGLFPHFVRCAVLPVSERSATPFPEELDAVATAVASRRREFVSGRACAHAALRALGVADAPILMASTRAPVWPHGVVGSIAHTRTMAGAVVCRSADARGLGLDLERADATVDERVRRLVLTPAEMEQVDDLRTIEERAPVLIFSAKECVHKVIAPLWAFRLDHQDVEIDIDLETHGFTAAVRLPGAGLDAVAAAAEQPRHTMRGSFSFFDDHVATGICLDAYAAATVAGETPVSP